MILDSTIIVNSTGRFPVLCRSYRTGPASPCSLWSNYRLQKESWLKSEVSWTWETGHQHENVCEWPKKWMRGIARGPETYFAAGSLHHMGIGDSMSWNGAAAFQQGLISGVPHRCRFVPKWSWLWFQPKKTAQRALLSRFYPGQNLFYSSMAVSTCALPSEPSWHDGHVVQKISLSNMS